MIKITKNKIKINGFTLIELMVVLSIVAVFASLVMSSLQSARQKAYDVQITSDLIQMKNALELYATDHNFVYPLVINLSSKESQFVQNKNVILTGSILTKFAYADTERDQNCIYFDNLASVLVPQYLGAMPEHPLEDGTNICYKYYAVGTGDIAVVYGPSVTQKYDSGINKQIGVALGKSDPISLSNICTENLNSNAGIQFGISPFPFFSGSDNRCSGAISDIVIGITSGEGNIEVISSCSISGYTDQVSCEADRSSCSNPSYTSQTDCENAGYWYGGYCSGFGHSDEYSCVNAGTYYGYCDDSSYTDEYSCVNAGAYSDGVCSNSSYTNQSDCENAGYTYPGYCTPADYGDEYSCITSGYQWTPSQFVSEGNYWNNPTYSSYNYQWNTYFISDNYYWSPGEWIPNIWTSNPGGVWTVY